MYFLGKSTSEGLKECFKDSIDGHRTAVRQIVQLFTKLKDADKALKSKDEEIEARDRALQSRETQLELAEQRYHDLQANFLITSQRLQDVEQSLATAHTEGMKMAAQQLSGKNAPGRVSLTAAHTAQKLQADDNAVKLGDWVTRVECAVLAQRLTDREMALSYALPLLAPSLLREVKGWWDGEKAARERSNVAEQHPSLDDLFAFLKKKLVNRQELLDLHKSMFPNSQNYRQRPGESTRDWSLRLARDASTLEFALDAQYHKSEKTQLDIFLQGLLSVDLQKECTDMAEGLRAEPNAIKRQTDAQILREVVHHALTEIEKYPKKYDEPKGRLNPSAAERLQTWRQPKTQQPKDGQGQKKRKRETRGEGPQPPLLSTAGAGPMGPFRTPPPRASDRCFTCHGSHPPPCRHAGNLVGKDLLDRQQRNVAR
jgi:hypothetical protein